MDSAPLVHLVQPQSSTSLSPVEEGFLAHPTSSPVDHEVLASPNLDKEFPVPTFTVGRMQKSGASTFFSRCQIDRYTPKKDTLERKNPGVVLAASTSKMLAQTEWSFARSDDSTDKLFHTKGGLFSRYAPFAVTEDVLKGVAILVVQPLETTNHLLSLLSFDRNESILTQIKEPFSFFNKAFGSTVYAVIFTIATLAIKTIATPVSIGVGFTYSVINLTLLASIKILTLGVGTVGFLVTVIASRTLSILPTDKVTNRLQRLQAFGQNLMAPKLQISENYRYLEGQIEEGQKQEKLAIELCTKLQEIFPDRHDLINETLFMSLNHPDFALPVKQLIFNLDTFALKGEEHSYREAIAAALLQELKAPREPSEATRVYQAALAAQTRIPRNIAIIRNPANVDRLFNIEIEKVFNRYPKLGLVAEKEPIIALILDQFVTECLKLPHDQLYISKATFPNGAVDLRYQHYWDLFCTTQIMNDKYRAELPPKGPSTKEMDAHTLAHPLEQHLQTHTSDIYQRSARALFEGDNYSLLCSRNAKDLFGDDAAKTLAGLPHLQSLLEQDPLMAFLFDEFVKGCQAEPYKKRPFNVGSTVTKTVQIGSEGQQTTMEWPTPDLRWRYFANIKRLHDVRARAQGLTGPDFKTSQGQTVQV